MNASILNIVSKAIALLLILTIISCSTNSSDDLGVATKSYPGVDEDLWVYFERFEQSAKDRGMIVDLIAEGITGEIHEISKANVVGLCNHNVIDPNHIIIDGHFWNRSATLKKELIIFHELGHCYLLRGHNDKVNDNGTCGSIMRSGTGGCLDLYTKDNRNDYLNELFDME